jgi:PTS system nitrogen regulatory IIA component
MNLISQSLSVSNVLLGLDTGNKKRLFEQIGMLFENSNGIARATTYDSLFAREKLGSTGLGHGIAIPHGRIKGLKHTLCAFVKPAAPIPWEAPDGLPAEMIFFILVPEKATEQHLQILSELAQMFSDKSFREAVAVAADAETVHRLLTTWTPYAATHHSAAL